MSQRGKELLKLKGINSDDELEEAPPLSRGNLMLQLHRRRKTDDVGKSQFNHLKFTWNVDGSLDTLTIDDGNVLHFIWNSDGSLSEVIRG